MNYLGDCFRLASIVRVSERGGKRSREGMIGGGE